MSNYRLTFHFENPNVVVVGGWESIDDDEFSDLVDEMSQQISNIDDTDALTIINSRGNSVALNSSCIAYVEYEKEQ